MLNVNTSVGAVSYVYRVYIYETPLLYIHNPQFRNQLPLRYSTITFRSFCSYYPSHGSTKSFLVDYDTNSFNLSISDSNPSTTDGSENTTLCSLYSNRSAIVF